VLRLVIGGAGGFAAFALLFTGAGYGSALAGVSVGMATVLVLLAVELGTRRLGARELALMAAICAIDAGLRLALVNGIGGFSPIFFLILCSGYVFGPSFGFLTGALALLVSAIATGGVGPWLPYEMFGCAWVGAAAGLVRPAGSAAPGRRDLFLLAAVGLVTGYAYGALTDVFDWSVIYRGAPGLGWMPGASPLTELANFARFYVSTSAVWDTFRAVGNALAVLAIGAPLIAALRRLRSRLAVTVVVEPVGEAA